MKKWLLLGLLGLAVAWGPYLYVQLTREPATAEPSASDAAPPGVPDDDDDDEASPEEEPALAQQAAEAPTEPGEPEGEGAEVAPGGGVVALGEAPAAEPEPEPAPAAANEAAPSAEPTVGVAARDTTAEKADTDDTDDTDDPQDEVVIPRLPQTLLPAFRKAFDSETRDAFWAADAEPQLTKLFQSQGVVGDALEEVACRKTVCRVEFRALDLEDKVLAALYTQLGKDYGTRLALDDGAQHDAERAALYVLREGYTLDEPAR